MGYKTLASQQKVLLSFFWPTLCSFLLKKYSFIYFLSWLTSLFFFIVNLTVYFFVHIKCTVVQKYKFVHVESHYSFGQWEIWVLIMSCKPCRNLVLPLSVQALLLLKLVLFKLYLPGFWAFPIWQTIFVFTQ